MINQTTCEMIMANESTVLTLPTPLIALLIVLGIFIVTTFIIILAILFDFIGVKKREKPI